MSGVSASTHTTELIGGARRSVLPSGLRVVTEHVPGVHSAAVGLWVAVGSRDEDPSVAGAAHYLEHLLFKGTPSRSALDIAQAMDAVGGELNAFTAKEYTCFYAHVLDADLPMAIELVSDVVLRGVCAEADVETERNVVLEEIAMRDDDPEDLVHEAFAEVLFGAHPLGRPIIGSVESVEAMTPEQLRTFHTRRYTPPRLVLAAAGNVDHDAVLAQVTATLGSHPAAAPVAVRGGIAELAGRPGTSVTERDSEQAHVVLGSRGLGRHDEARWALSVLSAAVGGGMSSRLFQQVREQRGLAYSIYSSVDTYADTGAFSVYAGCQPENLGEVVAVIDEVLATVAADGITEAELARGKGQLRGALVLGLEDTPSRMSRLGRSEVNYAEHLDVEETLARIDAVTCADVAAVAADVLRRPVGVAVVGPYAHADELPHQVRAACR
ncbi:pitrilysin family protein [Rhodococcus sp. X156]|uniref:M16 family metallopeptidase n=1 Tax=Rhodococcus sp. X156 TaxID=2499145 RepID=UPI000FDAD7EE|nr:pitrilysin family protein [Rhodococcus sp. X156]